MTIHANRKEAVDLTGKVLICKSRHYDYSSSLGARTNREWQAGDLVLVLAHESPKTAASFRAPVESVRFFLDGVSGSIEINASFDGNWAIIEPEDRLKGASFVFTGALQNTRDYYKKIVEMFGGEFAGSVTSKTKYLVMADKNSMTTKAVKARANGTTLLDERGFLELVKRGC